MNKFFTFAFLAFGGLLLYATVYSFLNAMPISGSLFLASTLLSLTASFCVRKRKWGYLVVVFLIFYPVVDLAIVRLHIGE